MLDLGAFLKRHREAAGLSQLQLADRIFARFGSGHGINQGALSRWERGEFQPSVRQLGMIGTALDLADEVIAEAVQASLADAVEAS